MGGDGHGGGSGESGESGRRDRGSGAIEDWECGVEDSDSIEWCDHRCGGGVSLGGQSVGGVITDRGGRGREVGLCVVAVVVRGRR